MKIHILGQVECSRHSCSFQHLKQNLFWSMSRFSFFMTLIVRHIQRNRKNSFLGLVDFSFCSEVFAFLAMLYRPKEMMQRSWGHTPHKPESLYSRSVNAR